MKCEDMKQRVVLTLPLQESSTEDTHRFSSFVYLKLWNKHEFVYLQANTRPVYILPDRVRTPQRRIYWPEEVQFICMLKKNSLVCLLVRQRFEGFLDLHEKVFLSTMSGAVYPRRLRFFFLSSCT
jgi:hypothetical protein